MSSEIAKTDYDSPFHSYLRQAATVGSLAAFEALLVDEMPE